MAVTQPGFDHTGRRRRGREVLAVILAVFAALFTGFFLWLVVDLVLNDYVGGDLLTEQVILGVVGSLAVYAWSGAVSLYKSARREVDPVARRLTIGGLVAVPAFLVTATVAPAGPIAVTAYVLAGVAAVVALVGAVRE